ncbi:hypothetical protein JTE90_028928 [Oedothorax gibbosus]|uniref:Methyltransferase type 11 domain-containing protein n=1 Tax=Oedothorax gibbosus TaxID=931172 RepID=A0AAV6VJ73_9ARAC|nr:hypothetical protein JTE90_028928 [Oedothorax gibbosus]
MTEMEVTAGDRCSRSVSLEKDYVNEVYERIGRNLVHAKDPLHNTVQKFLDGLEPGSLIADVGCGDGRHLKDTNNCYSIGTDCSVLQATLTHEHGKEAILGDNLQLPFRSDLFDGVLSVGVVHHLASKERRIQALQEIARVLRVGGRVLIAVRSQDSQHAQDVLMPWYDVKSKKDERWLDQDSGEYDLDENSDDDSISLPSSDDEDDHPVSRTAKFFPNLSSANGLSLESQCHSLDDDQQSSKSVPNTKPLMPINACYDFVRKAFRRLSSANSTEEDTSLKEKLQRVDSAVPPSPNQKDFSDSFLIPMSESLQKLVNNNFIELLNLDGASDLRLNPQFEDKSPDHPKSSFGDKSSKHSSSHSKPKTKHRLMRSLSDVFKNLPDLWSSKDVKSCSDLKSQALKIENTDTAWKEKAGQLKRSKTTATCSSSFDTLRRLESIGEIEMTLTEADQIVNDFLYSSMSSIETLKNREPSVEFDSFNTLSRSDITNGNILQGATSLELDSNGYTKTESKDIDFNLGSGGNFVRAPINIEDFFDTQLLETHPKHNEREGSIIHFEDSLMCDLNFSNTVDEGIENPRLCKTASKSQKNKRKDNKASDFYLDSFRFTNWDDTEQFSEFSVHATILEKQKIPSDNKESNTESCEENEMTQNSFTLDSYMIADSILSQHANILDQNTIYKVTSSAKENILEAECYVEQPFFENNKKEFIFSSSNSINESPTNRESWQFHNKTFESTANEINNDIPTSNNTNIHKSFLSNNEANQKFVEALGPFYDADNHTNILTENSSLCSYYSMPELHNLSNFKKEYVTYNSSVTNRANSDTLKRKNRYTEVIQERDIKRLQENTNFEAIQTKLIAQKDEGNGSILPPNLLQSSALNSDYHNQKFNYFTYENNDSNCKNLASSDSNNFFEIFPNSNLESSSVNIKSKNLPSVENTVHKYCSKSLDESFKQQNIDAINGTLNFNCADCTMYGENDNNEPSNYLNLPKIPSDLEKYFVENVQQDSSNQRSNKELFSNYPQLTDFAAKPKQNASCQSLQNFSNNFSAIENSQKEIGGTKRKYKLVDHTASEPSLINEINDVTAQKQFDIGDEENYPNASMISRRVSMPIAFFGSWKSEVFSCNPINEVSDLKSSNPAFSTQSLSEISSENLSRKPTDESENLLPNIPDLRSSAKGLERSNTNFEKKIVDTAIDLCRPNLEKPVKPVVKKSKRDIDPKSFSEAELPIQNINYFYGRVQEEGASVIMHRYHHLFDKVELEDLIENYISDLHILDYFHEQSHWCIVAEKVRVWTI